MALHLAAGHKQWEQGRGELAKRAGESAANVVGRSEENSARPEQESGSNEEATNVNEALAFTTGTEAQTGRESSAVSESEV